MVEVKDELTQAIENSKPTRPATPSPRHPVTSPHPDHSWKPNKVQMNKPMKKPRGRG